MPRLHWFLPENPDVLDMLHRQAEVTLEGMDALTEWAAGMEGAGDRVRDAEHRADEVKRELRGALRTAFITPIPAEDLYVMSERLDSVMNGAKDAVRESEVMGVPPDATVIAMAALLAEGVGHLATAFDLLEGRLKDAAEAATAAADAAIKTQRQTERAYRKGMSALLELQDLREEMGRRELYRRFSRLSETVTEVAERVWYASVKEA